MARSLGVTAHASVRSVHRVPPGLVKSSIPGFLRRSVLAGGTEHTIVRVKSSLSTCWDNKYGACSSIALVIALQNTGGSMSNTVVGGWVGGYVVAF
jgi:hypothetical protein